MTAERKSLVEVEIQRSIFWGDAPSPLSFVVAMIPPLRKSISRYKLHKLPEKINHLMYMNDIKLFAKNKKELETLIQEVCIYSENVGMKFGREKCI